MNAIDAHVGARIRAKRFQAGFTLSALASRIGISARRLLQYENGEGRIPAKTLVQLGRVLGARPIYFFKPPPTAPEIARPVAARGETPALPASSSAASEARDGLERLDRFAHATKVVVRRDETVARQMRIVETFERHGRADMAQLARDLLASIEQTRALFKKEKARICAEMARDAMEIRRAVAVAAGSTAAARASSSYDTLHPVDHGQRPNARDNVRQMLQVEHFHLKGHLAEVGGNLVEGDLVDIAAGLANQRRD